MWPFKRKKKLRKNVSQKIPNGRTLQTRDEFLASGKGYKKPGYENKGYYRKVVVVDSNRDNELAVVKLTTKGKHKLRNYKQGKSSYKAFIETKDDKNNPIVLGKKFRENSKKYDVSFSDVTEIKKSSLVKSSRKTKEVNKTRLRKLKSRK